MLCITLLNAVNSAPVSLKSIFVCILLTYKMGYPAYVIMYPECNMNFLLWYVIGPNSTLNWHLHDIQCFFYYPGFKLRRVWITRKNHLVDTHTLTYLKNTLRCV